MLFPPCRLVLFSMEQYAGREPGAAESRLIRQHLERCPACGRQAELRLRARQRLRQSVRSEPVPASLVAGVFAMIRAGAPN